MNLLKSLCCILTFNCFVVYATHSYPKQDTLYLSFDDAEKILSDKNVNINQQNVEMKMSEAELRQEKLFENPEISIQHNINNPVTGRYFECGKEGQSDIQISQRIYIGGQRSNRIKIAEANVRLSKSTLADTKRLLRRDLYSTMADIFYCKQKISIMQKETDVIDKILLSYDSQYNKGNISAVEVVRLKSQMVQLQKEVRGLEIDMMSKTNELRTMLRFDVNTHIVPQINEKEILGQIKNLTKDEIIEGIERRPDLEMAKQKVEMAEHNVKLQKANGLPELSVNGEWDKNGHIGHNYFGAGVTFTIPIFNRNQGTVKAAQHNLEAQMLEKEHLHDVIAIEKDQNWNRLLKLQEMVDETSKVAEEMSQQIILNVQRQYMNHNISLIELIDILDTYKEVQFTHTENKLELIKAFVSLDIQNN